MHWVMRISTCTEEQTMQNVTHTFFSDTKWNLRRQG